MGRMGSRALLLAGFAVTSVVAQNRPAFDAASIKPSTGSGGQLVRPVGDRVVATVLVIDHAERPSAD